MEFDEAFDTASRIRDASVPLLRELGWTLSDVDLGNDPDYVVDVTLQAYVKTGTPLPAEAGADAATYAEGVEDAGLCARMLGSITHLTSGKGAG
ncbi:hypothetical protein Xcel_2144 [Xylanimonas cellulosilytica DSM 15894]|uniref:Uncharacterized protein n=1 Tax=Xylanimonas cellulosilytica (strain DSM 15894 / JCM 12276 / CECT 5975 / KCTC 9989 / LMG 20990 / NBRC 107835 / XIL07) TaxID=446471 RepID=D1BUE9_XYLCX|nr:hypothetical protein [Xylanimonas cellulosilytica]ACZ31162.1 hypothetical protein Xcel_2144 [Xylanimonas cellulosilytica DSM 15894]